MVLESYRSTADKFLVPIVRLFMKWNPNSISVLSIVFAAISGLFIYLNGIFLLLSFFTLLFSALFDAIDGKLARLKNVSSPTGDLIDHVLDRYSDVFILLGFILGIYSQPAIGLAALVGVMLTSYMGTQSQALGLKRNYSGILGRADRLVFMMIFVLIQFFLPFRYLFYGVVITPVSILLIWFAIGGNATVVKRFLDTYKALAS